MRLTCCPPLPPTEAGSSALCAPVLSQISETKVGVKQSGRALLLCLAQGAAVDSCARKLCPYLGGLAEKLYSSGSTVGLLLRCGCVQGLHLLP